MKTRKMRTVTVHVKTLLIASALALLVLAGCGNAPSAAAADFVTVDAEGNTSVEPQAFAAALDTLPTGDLDEDEAAGLLYMREEEKLAHDVYLALYEAWGLPIFQNIANSEQTHTDAVKTLLDRYGLDDPAAGNPVGVFSDATLQSLYDELLAQGSQSLSEALKVGAAVEEIDILDLEEQLKQIDNDDIRVIYENLLKGSRNHLRAFTSTLERQTSEAYQPQYIERNAYDAIINSSIEHGGGQGYRGSTGGSRGNGGQGGKGRP